MLRNQLLGLKQIIDGLPPAASIARLDEDMNVLWEPQDGCLAWTGPASGAPAPDGGGSMQVFAPCSKAPSPDSVMWRLRRVPMRARQNESRRRGSGRRENKKPRPRGVGGDGKGRGFCPGRPRN